MSSVRHRRLAAFAVSATAVLALSGCGTGFSAQTNQQYDAGVGSNERGGKIEIHNALFVDNGDDTATFSAALLNKAATPDILTGVKATTTSGAAIESSFATPRELTPQTLFNPGPDGDIILTGTFPEGGFVKLTLEFEDTESITISAPIVTRNAMYDDVAEETVIPEPAAREEAVEAETAAAE